MIGLSKIDLHYGLRALAPGAYMVLLLYIFEKYKFTNLSVNIEFSAAGLAVGGVVGFLSDMLSLYKAHPLYRRIRRRFFLELYRIWSNTQESRPLPVADKILLAEQYREEILYSLDKERKKHLRIEHAIWIILYNISTLSILGALAIALLAVASPINVPKPYYAAGILVGIAMITIISAVGRNNSYGDKLLHFARNTKRTRKRKT